MRGRDLAEQDAQGGGRKPTRTYIVARCCTVTCSRATFFYGRWFFLRRARCRPFAGRYRRADVAVAQVGCDVIERPTDEDVRALPGACLSLRRRRLCRAQRCVGRARPAAASPPTTDQSRTHIAPAASRLAGSRSGPRWADAPIRMRVFPVGTDSVSATLAQHV